VGHLNSAGKKRASFIKPNAGRHVIGIKMKGRGERKRDISVTTLGKKTGRGKKERKGKKSDKKSRWYNLQVSPLR